MNERADRLTAAVARRPHEGAAALSLFSTSFVAVTATAFAFVLRGMVISEWGVAFDLTETEKGELLGVGLWPFAITIVLLSLIVDRVGFRRAFWFAAACHVAGLGLLLFANGYWSLYVGTFVMALGNGAVEAVVNPLVATLYRQDKPTWLNRLHAGWPLGLVAGGALAMALDGRVNWRVKVALMLIPMLIYIALLWRQHFPVSERVAAGVSYRAMLAEAGFVSAFVILSLMCLEIGRVTELPAWAIALVVALLTAIYGWFSRSAGRPLFIALILIMIPQAITELSTDSWITSLVEPELHAIGLNAGWVLVYTAAIMFVIRLFAGSLVRLLNPIGTLALAAALAGIGLAWLSGATGAVLFAAATVYAIGKSFFWGTSLALVSEQCPKGGAVTVNVAAGVGMLAAGILGTSLLGSIQDQAISRGLREQDATHGTRLAASYLTDTKQSAFGSYRGLDQLALKSAPPAERLQVEHITAASKKHALRDVAVLPLFMLLAYLSLLLFFRARGGYRPLDISSAGQGR